MLYLNGKSRIASHPVCCTIFKGMVTDGEFNSLRTQGETRPIHLWQLMHDSRESVSRQSAKTLLKILTKIGGRLLLHHILATF